MRERLPLTVLMLAFAFALPAQVPQLPTARLEGVVVDPMQRPVAGATVVVEVDGEERARTTSDGVGTFVIGKLPQGVVVVRATTSTPDIGGTWVDLLGIHRGFARITLMPARKVTGIVRDDQGKATAGAWVVSAPHDCVEFSHAACVAQADAQGRYELTHVPFGSVLLRAWAPGCDAGEVTLDGDGDRQQDLIVQSDGVDAQTFHLREADAAQRTTARLVVTASRRGLPVPLPPPLRRLSPDEHGDVVVAGWPRSDVIKAWFEVPGALVTPPRHTTVADVNDANWRFHVGATESCIRGRLVGNGLRVDGRLVLVQPIASEGSLWRVVGRTAADGSFILPSPVDRGLDFALRLGDGDATVDGQQPDPCWYVARHDSAEHRVPIVAGASVSLRALSHTGNPAPGAEVLVFNALTRPRSYPGLDEPLFAHGPVLARGVTDLDGQVTIRGLQLAAEDRIACVVLGGDGWAEVVTSVPTTRAADCGTSTLRTGGELDCTVSGTEDAPAPGGRLTIARGDSMLAARFTLAAGRDGHVSLRGMPAGNYYFAKVPPERHVYQRIQEGFNQITVR